MKCSFSRLLYPKTVEEARDGSYMIALFRPHEKVLDAQGNRLSSIKVVGHYLPTVSSVKVDMAGHWKKDARYGLQFEMESYEELVESSKAGIVSYLSSGMIPGIGKKLAERIYDTFGEQSLEVLDRDPTRIEEVSGISQKKRDQFCDAYIIAQAENDVAVQVCEMLCRDKLPYMGDLDDEIDAQQKEMGFTFAQEQRNAIKTSLTSPICIISGGPGTGKTSIQRAILNIYHAAFPNAAVVCCAPTGRAARRMEQSTGFAASTVHKALNLQAGEIHELREPETLKADLVLVDEVSMMDMITTWHLFAALPPGCRLILVGDADQLPSVGPGAVLHELLGCGKLPSVILDKVFRQSEGSIVAENAQRIRHGNERLDLGDDFQFWASADVSQSAQWLERLYMNEIARHGVDNVALLTPFRKKSETGVQSMNAALHDIANPPSPEKAELEIGQRTFRVGDKVMQMKNRDFASNGDIGYIRTIVRDADGFLVEVDFGDDRIVAYEDLESLRQLELAYATTIHKSQGAEYSSVLISVQNIHGRMLNRALFYTAETRAKIRVIVVGDWDAVVRAINTTDTDRRNTALAERINELIKE